ncbi:MAG TPA: VOC family protein [Candidatus Limnocylindria bacterium]|jgi:predicted enzyme related to lactoylglutathione lyase|nr:VOC family protein [Candidatus Limnocylindria bacterium]
MSARLIEIELRVRDVARSARFYRDLVGVTIGDIETHEADSEAHVHASWGEWTPKEPSLLMLNIYPATGPITSSNIGFAVSDLAAAHARLAAANVEVVHAPADRPWGRSAAYRDPDGNTVSLTETRR